MKLFLRSALVAAAPVCLAFAALAQAPAPQQSPASAQAPAAAPEAAPAGNGQVIFSRSADENGNVTTQTGAAAQPAALNAAEPTATDAERLAVGFTHLNLDVRLHPADHRIAVRALITVRNAGAVPLARLPLQLSSSLHWDQIRMAGRNASFPVATLNSDADHTGQLHEAALPLATPLAPGASLDLDVAYSGTIEASARRLTAIGAPEAVALHSDWDEIAPAFTGLRGFGNVVWYPVASVPIVLGDGARLFNEIGRHKLSLTGARFSLHLTVEFPRGDVPTVALVNGLPVALAVSEEHSLDPTLEGIATASTGPATLGFDAPSLFVAERESHSAGEHIAAWTLPDEPAAAGRWADAAAVVAPTVQRWLGPAPRDPVTLLSLPDSADAPFETGALLVTALGQVPNERIAGNLAHLLAHAYAQSAARPASAWLNEGLATFVESIWVEHTQGRDQALQFLESSRTALALAEPSSPGERPGTPLARAIAPAYYRTKAAYVLWMLRDLVGDEALGSALRACLLPPAGQGSATAQAPCSLQSELRLAAQQRDLSWFFADWVDADKGLPDLSIAGVFPSAASNGTYLVAVRIANAGYAATEIPVTVTSTVSPVTERVLVPARGEITQRILVTGAPTQVQVNDGIVPETEASVHITTIDTPAPPATDGPVPHKQPRGKTN